MLSPRMRPRFELRVPLSPPKVLDRLNECLARPDSPCVGARAGNHLHLKIRKADRRIWSPHLNLEITPQPETDRKASVIHGHFGPRADIWTLIVALYAILGFVGVVGLIFGLSQWMLKMPLTAFWVSGAALVLGGIVYALALTGQILSQGQMNQLLTYVQGTLEG